MIICILVFFFEHFRHLSKMSGIFYGQDACDEISNQASTNGKWLWREFNITSDRIHGFSYVTNMCIIMSKIIIISAKLLNVRRKWINLDEFAVIVR